MFHLLKRLRKAGIKARRPTFIFFRRHTRPLRMMTQEKFIGRSYYSLADFGWLDFDVSGLRKKRAVSIFTWRHSVESFEISDEMTFIS